MDIKNKLDRDAPDLAAKQRPSNRITRRFKAELSTNHVDILLLACCLCSGLTDSTLYNAYSTFVSMQTGNTIFVALGASHQNTKPYGWARSLCSIGCFVLGSLFFSRLSLLLGPKRRIALTTSFALQTMFVVVAAAIVQGGAIDGAVPQRTSSADAAVHWNELAPIALLSFQSAGQIVCSRALGLGEVPTVVVTSLLCDLMSDTALLAGLTANVKRNRRAAAFALTLVGAIAGGWISKATRGVEYALWVVAGIKLGITAAWALWREKV
ncbi:uncharacterized protein BKCO1_24000137 [Diplodia corticola]|uniref:DUF1275 domain protein n=1 Tax=Diplodia corticola TaxID=236234 RepID=A0A1J9RNS3_9PEZI|nr:uncharacterized protein BKCO1_24000137 [Diplodia corticola]OJD34195.1 hypothetical protein BKCO1_24000137 [Diplodia corticola]